MNKDRDNAANFVEYMCNEGCAFSKVSKQLGTFVAVLFYLREFEKWLKSRAKEQGEPKPLPTTQVKSSADAMVKQICKLHKEGQPCRLVGKGVCGTTVRYDRCGKEACVSKHLLT